MPDHSQCPDRAEEKKNLADTMLRAAEIIVRSRAHPAPISRGQAAEFAVAADRGWINLTSDQISFATPELLQTWVPQYCAQNISDAWDDLVEFEKAFLEAQGLARKLELPRSCMALLIESLEKECNKRVLTRLVEIARAGTGALKEGNLLSLIFFPFCEALPELAYEPVELFEQLDPVIASIDGFGPGIKLNEAFREIAKHSQVKAEALIEAFTLRPWANTVELAAISLTVLWTFDQSAAHKRALELTRTDVPILQRAGVLALGGFAYDLPSNESEILATIDRLEELTASDDSDLSAKTASALGNLLALPLGEHNSQQIKDGILKLSSHEEPSVQLAVGRVLWMRTVDSGDANWFWDALRRLSHVTANHEELLDSVDCSLYRMVGTHPNQVLDHLEYVVTSRPYGNERGMVRLPGFLKQTLDGLLEQQRAKIESTITKWFASKDSRLHLAAAEIVSQCVQETRVKPDRTLKLDSEALDALDESDVERVVFALLGYVDDRRTLAALLISIFSQKQPSYRLSELVEDALVREVLYDMPAKAGDYLRSLTEEEGTPDPVREIVRDALGRSEEYYALLRNRPILKELMPPDSRVIRYNTAYNKQFQTIRDKALKGSRLMSMIPTTPVKYGRASFSAEHGTPASSLPFAEVRTEFEGSRWNVIDPIGRFLIQLNWRRMAVAELSHQSAIDKSAPSKDTQE